MIRSMRRYSVLLVWVSLLAYSPEADGQAVEETRTLLFALERESHQQWLESNLAALDELMAEEFHFVAMNGAVETKADVVGTAQGTAPAARPLQVQRLHVEPEQFALRGNVAVVIGLLHLDATVRGRAVPPRMRVLSIFTRDEAGTEWKLTARSITPILAPPGEARGEAGTRTEATRERL